MSIRDASRAQQILMVNDLLNRTSPYGRAMRAQGIPRAQRRPQILMGHDMIKQSPWAAARARGRRRHADDAAYGGLRSRTWDTTSFASTETPAHPLTSNHDKALAQS